MSTASSPRCVTAAALARRDGRLHEPRRRRGRCPRPTSPRAGARIRGAPARRPGRAPIRSRRSTARWRGSGPVVVAGSLYLVGVARGHLVDDPDLRDPGRRGPTRPRSSADLGVAGLGDDPDRPARLPLGRAHVRDGHPQRDPRFVLGRRAAGGGGDPVEAALATGRRMVEEGADILDVGGESTRPGHVPVAEDEERRRIVPVIAALRAALPDTPLSIDTTKPAVAEAALAAGADLINDVWAVGDGRRAGPTRRRPRRARSSSCTTGPRPATRASCPSSSRTSSARSSAPLRLGLRVGGPHRRSRLRVRQDRRAQPRAAARARRRCACWAGRSCSGPAASRPSVASWTCRPTSASRHRWPRPRWASPAVPTSSGSTTCRPTSGRPG